MHPETLAHTRDRYRHRTRRLHGQSKGVADGGEETISTADRRLARELLVVERRGPPRRRGEGAVSDGGRRGGPRAIELAGRLPRGARPPARRARAHRPRAGPRPP